jgi:hypothetical protein
MRLCCIWFRNAEKLHLHSVLYCCFQTQHFCPIFLALVWRFLDIVAKYLTELFGQFCQFCQFFPHLWQMGGEKSVTYCRIMWQNSVKTILTDLLKNSVSFFLAFRADGGKSQWSCSRRLRHWKIRPEMQKLNIILSADAAQAAQTIGSGNMHEQCFAIWESYCNSVSKAKIK